MSRPNILFLMTDQMQGRVLDAEHPCQTPNLDRLMERGVRVQRAYTPNPVCSPARASLMTGLLPHEHGVLWVTHSVDPDQGNLRTEHPHWAQRLVEAGYRTGYFGKWHVEHTESPGSFGWQVDGSVHQPMFKEHVRQVRGEKPAKRNYSLVHYADQPEGYRPTVHYGVTDEPASQRRMGMVTGLAEQFIKASHGGDEPWCCFVSTDEPHDPFVCGQEAFDRYDVDALPMPANWGDDLAGRPNIYRKSTAAFKHMTDRQRREAAACYYASITELDEQFGRLLDLLETTGQVDNTIVVLTSDHGELLGAHGMYYKNFSAYEEIYQIPMVLAGPGIVEGQVSGGRVGLHDVGSTLLDLVGLPVLENEHSRSFAPLLRKPDDVEGFAQGYAEYTGTRMMISQRVFWDGDWKLVLNGFDFDELYNLANDPQEMNNLADDPDQQGRIREMMCDVYRIVRRTGDNMIGKPNYPPLRVMPFGPGILENAD